MALSIPKPYELLNADDVREFEEIHSLLGTRFPYPNPKELRRKTTDLFWLGVFQSRSHARIDSNLNILLRPLRKDELEDIREVIDGPMGTPALGILQSDCAQ